MQSFEGAIVRGWSLSGTVHAQSGAPLTATDSINIGSSGISATRRAQIVPGQALRFSGPCSNAHALCWFNPAAFVKESMLGAGDAPVNDLIGPGYYQWDLSLRKTFSLPWREGMKIELQGDAFNALNHANWNNPNTDVSKGTSFGQITGSLPARVVQLGGKFLF